MKKNIIRIGDTVKIIDPEFFIRCGYNLCLSEVTEKIIKERKEEIEQFIDKFFKFNMIPNEIFGFMSDENISDTGKEIAKALAYKQIQLEGFGGKERKIFTETKEEYKNKLFKVTDIKYHQTGTYYPPSGGYSYYSDDWDYESGGLKNMKVHKILYLWPYDIGFFDIPFGDLSIETIHVEKINENYCEE